MPIPANTASIGEIRSTIRSLEHNNQNTQPTSPVRDGGGGSKGGGGFYGGKTGSKVKRGSK